ncbi:hypothetical protein D3C84_1134830 [compost metagenome]
MLDRRQHVLALNTFDTFPSHSPGQQWVFTEILKVSAVARVAREVDPTRKQDVKALAPSLVTDHLAAAVGDLRIPTRGAT